MPTYVVFPHVHVAALQHGVAVPEQVAFLYFGPQRPSVDRSGSISVFSLLVLSQERPRYQG